MKQGLMLQSLDSFHPFGQRLIHELFFFFLQEFFVGVHREFPYQRAVRREVKLLKYLDAALLFDMSQHPL